MVNAAEMTIKSVTGDINNNQDDFMKLVISYTMYKIGKFSHLHLFIHMV